MTVTAPVTNNWLIQAGYSFAEFYWKGGPPERLSCPTRRGSSVYAGVGCDGADRRLGSESKFPGPVYVRHRMHDLEHDAAAATGKRPQRHEGVRLVRHGVAQHQGGLREHVRARPPAQEHAQRPPDGVLCQQSADDRRPSSTIPTISPAYVAYDVGLYAQDSWTIKRLTVNPGIRIVWIETGMYESSMAAGRFVPARFIRGREGADQLRC